MEDQSQQTSPEEDLRTVSRDYLERTASSASRSTGQSRTRHGEFTFGPATLRHRLGSGQTSANPSPGPAAPSITGVLNSSRRSIAVAPPPRQDDDAASRRFSLAGPQPLDTLAANQPYVDPGYAQLNPAYDQPVNVRPVWGLAKPLPHVLRPGMVPATDELEREVQKQHEEVATQPEARMDLEAGRIEPTLRPDRVSDQLDTIRREREISLYRAYQQLNDESPTVSPYAAPRRRRTSDAPTETPHSRLRETIREEPEDGRPEQQPDQPLEEELPQLPEAIATVKQAREEDALQLPYQDAVPLPAYNAEDDEIHNLHTYWSLIRLRFREPLAELLGVSHSLPRTPDHASTLVNSEMADHGAIHTRFQRESFNDGIARCSRRRRHRSLGMGSRDHDSHLRRRRHIRRTPQPSHITDVVHLPRFPAQQDPSLRRGADGWSISRHADLLRSIPTRTSRPAR